LAALPAHTGYLLAGDNFGTGFSGNALAIWDVDTMQVLQTVDLPNSRAAGFSRDPVGRLWIGLSGDMQRGDNKVLVYSPEGVLLKTLQLCTDPEAGITFAAGRVFIACTEDGFKGKVVVLDGESLAPVKELEFSVPGGPYYLTANAATEQRVVLAGMTTGADPNSSYAALVVIDPRTLAVEGPVVLGAGTDIWSILPDGERFYLLNVASAHASAETRRDLLVLEAGAPLTWTVQNLPEASPLWGIISGKSLYAYHNPGWNTTQVLSQRAVTRWDLETGATERWSLPDEFDGGSVAVVDGRPCLTHWQYAPESEHGLYCLDVTGQWQLMLPFKEALRVIIP